METITELEQCVACGSHNLELTLDLGQQPLANGYLDSADQSEEAYPLAVNRCHECNHLQLTHVVNPELIYKNYSYVSGTSQTYLDYMDWFARWCREYANCWHGTVLDIGCNDGSQLDAFARIGFTTYGVDPAENLYDIAKSKKHKVVCGFWDKDTAKKLKHDKFDIAVSQNAFAHIPDPVKYLKTLEKVMNPKGLFFVQTSQANMVVNGEFDTIYHEHISFYNIKSMKKLAKQADWELYDVIKTPIHGTSYVFVLSPTHRRPRHIENLLAWESNLQKAETYTAWAQRAQQIKLDFESTCQDYKQSGFRIIGYGAAAKGMTLLNYVSDVEMDCIIDDNPLKQGKFSPGKKIPIVSSDSIAKLPLSERVLFVPLAWNVFDEIKHKILQHRGHADDRFLRYFPEVTVEY